MNLLFKREQTSGKMGRVKFKLWGKVELDDDEKAIVKRYRFDNAILIAAIQPELIRRCLYISGGIFVVGSAIFSAIFTFVVGSILGAIAAAGGAYWYFHQNRETIFVKDLIHGRHFTCDSVIELARKEAWLEYVSAFLRQVMESAKHWDGTETHAITPLPKDEARQVIIRGL
jgi:hypothetical protein